jgi:hypothetical protein
MMKDGRTKPGTRTDRATVASDEGLKRTLERNTAVQGEREVTESTRQPPDADPALPTARSTGGARSRKAK